MTAPEVIGKDEHGFPVYASDPTPPPGFVSDDGITYDGLHLTEDVPAVDLGGGFHLTAADRPRWIHECGVLRPDGRRTARIRVGMALHPDHVVTRSPAGITIRASILCGRCGAHGFVTDSRWVPA